MPNQGSSLILLDTCRFSTPITPNIAAPYVAFNLGKSNRTTQSGIWKGCGNDVAEIRMPHRCLIDASYMPHIF
jgi:hypothetical protein